MCLCRVETLESLPEHSFNGVIISSVRVCTLQSPFVFLFLMILIYTSLKARYLPVFVSRLYEFLTLRFFGLVLDLVMYCQFLLYFVCTGPTACLHRYLLPIIAGTNTAFYLMVLLPIQLYEYH